MPARIISSPVVVQNANIPIHKLIVEKSKLFKEQTFLIEFETGTEYTYGTLLNDSLRVASALKNSKLNPGDIFMIYGFNCYEYVVAFLSGLLVGGIALPLRGVDATSEFCKEIESKDVRFLFIAFKLKKAAAAVKKESTQIKDVILFDGVENDSDFKCIRSLVKENKALSDNEIYDPRGNQQSIATLLESSGTTGPSKRAQLAHYDLSTTFLAKNALNANINGHTFLGASPFGHLSGFASLFITLMSGIKIITVRNSSAEECAKAIGKYKVTRAILCPTMINELLKIENVVDLSALRTVFSGGTRLPKGLGDEFVNKFKIQEFRNAYTMTEITILATVGEHKLGHFESIGKVSPGIKIKIVDTESGNILGENETGEICVKGPFAFKGYCKNEKATNELIDKDGFIKTGDIGYFDESENFFLIDRKKEILKSRYGWGYSPVDVEEVLVKHDAVKEVAVVGIPDETTSETPHAFVVLKESVKKESIDKQELIDFVNKQLSAVKHLKVVHFVDELPKTNFGKILRRKIRDEFLKNNRCK